MDIEIEIEVDQKRKTVEWLWSSSAVLEALTYSSTNAGRQCVGLIIGLYGPRKLKAVLLSTGRAISASRERDAF